MAAKTVSRILARVDRPHAAVSSPDTRNQDAADADDYDDDYDLLRNASDRSCCVHCRVSLLALAICVPRKKEANKERGLTQKKNDVRGRKLKLY